MKKILFYILSLVSVLCLVSCGESEETETANSPVGEWRGTMDVLNAEDGSVNYVDVEFSLKKSGGFEMKYSGMKLYDEDKGDAYQINRGDYAIDADTILLYFDYQEYYGGSESDEVHYADEKGEDGNWYRINLDGDGYPWDEIPESSPQYIKVNANKYRIVYLNGEESWIHHGRFIWRMTSTGKLVITTYRGGTELYTLSRK